MIEIDRPSYADEFEIDLSDFRESRMINHTRLDILYVLSGKARIKTFRDNYVIVENHFCVMNPGELYRVVPDDFCYALCFSASAALTGNQDCYFSCISSDKKISEEVFDHIRFQLSRMFQLYYKDAENNRPLIFSNLFAVLGTLEKYFSVVDDAQRNHEMNMSQLEKILAYIQENCAWKLTLQDLADHFYLSTGHISRLFQKQLHTTFSDYLRDLRTNNAYRLLRTTEMSVSEIAMETGFGSVNQMIEGFKRYYGETPGKIRKLTYEEKRYETKAEKELLDRFLSYARTEPPAEPSVRSIERIHYRIEAPLDGKKYTPGFFRLINVGFAKDILLAPIQEQLRICQERIGFDYIRFHGIFDEDMMVYREDSKGRPRYNFNYLDMVYDFVLSLGFQIFVEFSYYPKALASDKEPLYHRNSYISGLPNSIEKWCALVQETVRHCIRRYGQETVRKWRFRTGEALNIYFRRMSFEDYLLFYTSTFRAVKEVDPLLQFGGLNLDFGQLQVNDQKDLEQYLERLKESGCLPDFYSFQCFHNEYSLDYETSRISTKFHTSEPFTLSENENYLADNVKKIRKKIRKYDDRNKNLILDTWNATMWQRDLRNDTCFKSAFLVKNMLENAVSIQGFGYWVLSDLFEEVHAPSQLFHGGYGLLTYNGIPKASFNAFMLLKKLGSRFVQAGDGYYVTCSSSGQVQIALYNYCHYDTLSRQNVFMEGANYDRYEMFKNEKAREYNIFLDLPDGEYEAEKYSISRSRRNGSAYEVWLDMGAPEEMNAERLEYLKRESYPSYRTDRYRADKGLLLCEELEAHEVRVIILTHKSNL